MHQPHPLSGQESEISERSPVMPHLVFPADIANPQPRGEEGMTTAEYAVGTVSACGFAGLLFKLLTSDLGRNLLEGIFSSITDLLPF